MFIITVMSGHATHPVSGTASQNSHNYKLDVYLLKN